MEKIRKSIEDLEIETSYGILKVTVSIGGVSFEKDLLSAINNSDAMIGFADIALNRAKDKGRNRVCIG